VLPGLWVPTHDLNLHGRIKHRSQVMFEHSCVEALEFAKHLRKSCKAVEEGGVARDYFA
jgi:hypothetical protein